LHAIAASWPPARRGLGPGRFRWRIRVLAGQIGIDVALLIEPFVRAILRQPAMKSPSRLIATGVPTRRLQMYCPMRISKRIASKTTVSFVMIL